eukprot:GFYU01003348.1.p1 GENE.GFYU01003348.1~~GFYU01003348.1.p1  ORF type:complete len:802 (-),score=199.68 GFYU01003348.1:246-2651(-)
MFFRPSLVSNVATPTPHQPIPIPKTSDQSIRHRFVDKVVMRPEMLAEFASKQQQQRNEQKQSAGNYSTSGKTSFCPSPNTDFLSQGSSYDSNTSELGTSVSSYSFSNLGASPNMLSPQRPPPAMRRSSLQNMLGASDLEQDEDEYGISQELLPLGIGSSGNLEADLDAPECAVSDKSADSESVGERERPHGDEEYVATPTSVVRLMKRVAAANEEIPSMGNSRKDIEAVIKETEKVLHLLQLCLGPARPTMRVVLHDYYKSTMKLLEQEDIDRFWRLMSMYIAVAGPNELGENLDSMRTALDFLRILDLPRVEQVNALIGHSPSKEVVSRCVPLAKGQLVDGMLVALRVYPSGDAAGAVDGDVYKFCRVSVSEEADIEETGVLTHTTAASSVGSCGSAGVRSDDVEDNGSVGSAAGGDVGIVFVDGYETERRLVPLSDLFQLSTRDSARMRDINAVRKMVVDPLSRATTDARDDAFSNSLEVLHENSITTMVTEEDTAKLSAATLDTLNSQLMQLEHLCGQEEGQGALLHRIEKDFDQQRKHILEHCEFMDGLFYPGRDGNIADLTASDIRKDILRRWRTFSCCIVSAIMQQSLCKEACLCLDGTRSNEMNKWWLDHTRDAVNSFLKELGYDFGAVPFDYTSTPPDDIPAVQRNLQLVNEVLDEENDPHGVHKLLEDVRTVVYGRVDEFITTAEAHIADAKSMLSRCLVSNTAADGDSLKTAGDVESDCGASHSGVCGHYRHRICKLADNIQYLSEMRSYEPGGKNAGVKSLDVVPISGIVLSRFVRMKHELDTVLMEWKE